MFNSFVRNVLSQFSTSKSNASGSRVRFGSKQSENKSLRRRALRLEQLEDRALLSVSTGEYADIREAYPALELPETAANLNVIEIEATNLTIENLKAAIAEAGTTTEDDLIVVRTTDDLNSIVYSNESDEIVIAIDSSKYGELNIVALGTQSLTLDAAQKTRVLNVNDGNIGLANLTITGGKKDAQTVGGGVFVYEGGLTLTNSTISGNSTLSEGGGVFVYLGSLTLTNSTVSGNSSGTEGGGVFVCYTDSLTTTNSTVSGNSALDGGGVYVASGTFTACNTILSQNYGGNLYGSFSSSSTNNLIDVSPSFVCEPEFDESGVLTNGESLDFRLRDDSPAINAGDDQSAYDAGLTVDSTDLAGEARFVGSSIDIGAYEKQTKTLTRIGTSTSRPMLGVKITTTLYVGTTARQDATATYQWYRVDGIGNATAIDGATSSSYTPTSDDVGYKLRVTAVGTGLYAGTVTATHSKPIDLTEMLTRIVSSTSRPTTGVEITTTLFVGTTARQDATATYQWYRVDGSGKATAIDGATSSSYTPTSDDLGYKLRVTAVGTGYYDGTVTATHSKPTDLPETLTRIKTSTSQPTAGVEITTTLYVGTTAKQDATATYQWYRVDGSGKGTAIDGATSSSYTPTSDDVGYKLRVTAVGTDYYAGTVTATHTKPTVLTETLTRISTSTNRPTTGVEITTTLYVGTTAKQGAIATYQWYRVDGSGKAIMIDGATNSSYTPTSADVGYKLRVTAIGTGSYVGTVTATHSAATSVQTSDPILNVDYAPSFGSQLSFAAPARDADASAFRSVFEDSSFVPFEDEDDFGLGQEL